MANEVMSADKTAQRSLNMGSKRSRVINQFDAIMARARNLYKKSWIDRGIGAKQKSLKKAIEEGDTLDYTRDVFYREFAHRVDILLDSCFFKTKCQNAGYIPFNAATHIVMMYGKKGIESLIIDRNYDGEESVFKPFAEWREPILTREELSPFLIDNENLHTEGR